MTSPDHHAPPLFDRPEGDGVRTPDTEGTLAHTGSQLFAEDHTIAVPDQLVTSQPGIGDHTQPLTDTTIPYTAGGALSRWASTRLASLEAQGIRRHLTPVDLDGPWVRIAGGRRLNFASNDYLGLGGDQGIRAAFQTLAAFTSASARLQTGTTLDHDQLETAAARFWGHPVLAMGSGWHANVGVLSAIADRDTVVIADKQVHASILDGIRLSGARLIRYRHQDLDHLAHLLATHAPVARTLVVTESVFSMDGDYLDVAQFVAITSTYPEVITVVDEAHALGALGPGGRGLVADAGATHAIDVRIGPLGKAMASVGAFVGCRQPVKDYLISSARSFLFSTALPPVQAAWTHYLLPIVEGASHRRQALAQVSTQLRDGITRITGKEPPGQGHIIPIIIGPNEATRHLAAQCQRLGWHVMAILPPTVMYGSARLRLSMRADMPGEAIDAFLDDFDRLWARYAHD